MRKLVWIFALVACVGCPAEDSSPPRRGQPQAPAVDAYANDSEPVDFEDWYPQSIEPPAGTRYPCKLTALPRELPGIPNRDRRFINHVYSQILLVTQTKLEAYQALGRKDQAEVLAKYRKVSEEAQQKIEAEPVPEGLQVFRDEVLEAFALHRTFFDAAGEAVSKKVAELREAQRAKRKALPRPANAAERAQRREAERKAWRESYNAFWTQLHQRPEVGSASSKLISAWGRMQARYGKHWPADMKDSIYHHLCALDLK